MREIVFTLKVQNKISTVQGSQVEESPSDLTFEEVCPIWSKKMKSGLNKKDRLTMYNDSKYCLVGEAWGFTGRHAGYYIAPLIPIVGCWTCVTYGRKFGNLARNNYSHLSEYQPLINDFISHWNQKHIHFTKKISNNNSINRG
jgi:hypothetical protein